MTLGERIKLRRKELGLTQVQLGEMVHKSSQVVSNWERGYTTAMSPEDLQNIAQALNVHISELMDNPAPAQPPAQKVTHYTYRIPVVGRVAAGQPILAQEEIIDYEYIDERLHKGGDQYFGLVVKGSSMEPTIHDGDTIIVRVQETVENGQIAVVLVDGEDATVKEVKESEDGLTLIGHNVAVYTPHFYSREEVEKLPVHIIGRVIQSISKF